MNIYSLLKKYWPLLLVLLVGGSLRLFGLLQNPISLFSDEVDMGYQAYSLTKTGCDYSGYCLPLQIHSFSDVQPAIPIYLIALFHFIGVPLDLSVRLSSAIFGILGIFITYFLVEKLASKKIFDFNLPGVGLMSSLVLALAPWHLTYSRIGFSLVLLYFFVTTGFYLFTKFITDHKDRYLYLSSFFLALSPMVYNTGKLSVIFYPFILLLLPGAFNLFLKSTKVKIVLLAMFLPLCILFLNGNTAARFDYISIFTDPTASTEVNYERLLDSGPGAGVGSILSLFTKLFHNKPLFYAENLTNNVFGLLSTDFFFTKGDPILRHSPTGWGMLYRSLAPVLLVGLYFLIRNGRIRLLLVLSLLVIIAISTSAVTRDGASHGSRSFMMLQPLVFVLGVGLAYVFKHIKILGFLFFGLIFIESIFFMHDYWYHYRYYSASSFSFGMKEIIESSKKYPGHPIVISPKNENPLIFYAYYNQYDPKKFQKFIQSHTLYNNTNGSNNLDGNRIGDSDFYIASLIDYQNKNSQSLPGAIYFITKLEAINSGVLSAASVRDIIRLPTGEPLYYEISF